jgi:hypothetical protein
MSGDDLVERLRDSDTAWSVTRPGHRSICGDAADEIERLRAEIKRLRLTGHELLDAYVSDHVDNGKPYSADLVDHFGRALDGEA